MSYSININREVTMEVFNLIPKASCQREATLNYEKALKDEVMNLTKEVRYQIEKSSRAGEFSAVVEIKLNEISAWSISELKYYIMVILKDLGYKVWCSNNDKEVCNMTIEW